MPNNPFEKSAIIELDHVSLVRGATRILDSVSFRIEPGEHTSILGPNGSGKSTLLKLLLRNLYPSIVEGRAGTVRMFGDTEWNVWDLRTKLGFVSGEIDHHFMMGRSGRLTAKQAVLTGFFSSELEPDEAWITQEMLDKADASIDLMGMSALAQRHLGHMSTGERRRVMLARAMVHRPIALVLDEPTSGLDLRAQDQLLKQLEVLASIGTTLILVTHHMDEILPCIGRTLLLGDGVVRFDGATDQAMQADRLSQTFRCPLRVSRNASGYWRVEMIRYG